MTFLTRRALKSTVQYWADIYEGIGIEWDDRPHALCRRFQGRAGICGRRKLNGEWELCPVAAATKKLECKETPVEDWHACFGSKTDGRAVYDTHTSVAAGRVHRFFLDILEKANHGR